MRELSVIISIPAENTLQSKGVLIPLHFALLLAVCLAACSRHQQQTQRLQSLSIHSVDSTGSGGWNPRMAAAYLDEREAWWMGWKGAARDNSTFCVSCHTTIPYILARAKLDSVLGEPFPSPDEQKLFDNVSQRVRDWKTDAPYYEDSLKYPHQSQNARGTESVLNALILVNRDFGSGRISEDAKLALDNMWDEQMQGGDQRGAWPWQEFDLEPWESRNSVYYGATLAAVVVGMTPPGYRLSPAVQAHIALLRDYLNRNYPEQCMFNRLQLLWAATRIAGLVDARLESDIVAQTLAKQRTDGGWNFPSLVAVDGWNSARWMALFNRRRDGTRQYAGSDGLATGLVVSSLLQAGVSAKNPQVARGLEWLRQHQRLSDGSWVAYSYNEERDPQSYVGHFMTDAATGYAALALSEWADQSRVQGRS